MTVFVPLLLLSALANPSIDVRSIPANSVEVPVQFQAQALDLNPRTAYRLSYREGGKTIRIPLQISKQQDQTAFFVLPPKSVPDGGRLTLNVQKGGSRGSLPFRFDKRDGKYLDLFENDKPVWVYNYGTVEKEGVPEDRYRSCYFHPVYGIGGQLITDDFPRDHYHHRGIWWSWPGLKVGEKPVDIWHMKGIRHRFEQWLYEETGPVCARFGVQNGWYMGEKRAAEERVFCTVYPAGEKGRALDITIHLKAGDEPIQLSGQPKDNAGYGGLYFRVPPGRDKIITGPSGWLKNSSNHVQMPWVDYSGRFNADQTFSGGSIFVPTHHPDFPPGWTIRYYGVFGVAWPGTKHVMMQPGDEVEISYRVWLHGGDVDGGNVREAYDAYALTQAAITSGE